MKNKRKMNKLLFPIIIIISFLVVKFWAQVECQEEEKTFVESFDTINFKDEERSSVDHWGDGYITLGLAGVLQRFPTAANFPTWINQIAYGDFDFDGLEDFLGTSDIYYKRIAFIKNLGEGSFQELSPYILDEDSSGYKLNSLLAGDFDNDEDPDFMYALSSVSAGSPVAGLEEVWFGEHQGTLDGNGVPQFIIQDYSNLIPGLEAIGWGPTHQSIDFDGDGDIDVLFCNGYGKVILLINDGGKPLSDNTKFNATTLIDAKDGETGNRWDERGVNAVATGDFDGDNDVDLIIGAVNWRGIKYYKNDGTGNFTLYKVLGDMEDPIDLGDNDYDGACTAIAVEDYDGDGDLDFLIGTDNWNPQETYPPGYEAGSTESHPCAGTYNTGTTMGAKVFYFKNDGTGEFTSTLIYDGHQLINEGECAAWDFDFGLAFDNEGDGDIDLMVADGNHSQFYYIFENVVTNRFNLSGLAISTNITAESFPEGLDSDEYSITKVQFTALDQSYVGQKEGLKITYYVSNNGGKIWEFYAEYEKSKIENCTDLPVHTFSTFGTDLRWKAVMTASDDYPNEEDEFHGTSNDTPRIDRIELKYYFVGRQEYSRTSVVSTSIIDEDNNEIKLIIGGTFIFPGWEGHLRAYDVSGMTLEETSYSILRTVSRQDLSGPYGREIVAEGVDILWDAGVILNSRPSTDRIIYTAICPGEGEEEEGQEGWCSNFTRIEFIVANVEILEPILQDVNNDNEGLINFVRGEGRYWKLGDINHSNPIVVGPPNEVADLMGSGYDVFKETWKDRNKVLYVGANDGMLHCFDVSTGEELWGFIPYNLLPKLKNMWAVSQDNGERYFVRDVYVDGSPVAADVYIDLNGDGSKEWRTILLCGQGPGKGSSIGGGTNYYFALDITDPSDPKPVGEFTHNKMGETWSVPVIGKIVKNGEDAWVAFMGSGYNNTKGEGTYKGDRFYALDLETGENFWKFHSYDVNTEGTLGMNINNALPGSPSIIDIDLDGYADRVYIGDLDGRVWKIDVSLSFVGEESWSEEVIYEDSNNYPIITKPAVWLDLVATEAVPRLYFGTGGDEKALSDASYSFVSLIDGITPEVEWYLGDPEILNLPEEKNRGDLGVGQKVWADPKVANYIVYFNTFEGSIESVDPCENLAGLSKLYARYIQAVSGAAIGSTAFKTESGLTESLSLFIKTRSAVTLGEKRERTESGARRREVYIQEYDSTIQRLEQGVLGVLKVKSWREIYRIVK